MTPSYEQDVNRGSPVAGVDGLPRAEGHLGALRAYLRGIAQVTPLRPDEEMALCRRIDAEHRALTEALLAVPSAARRLRVLSGVTGDDREPDARCRMRATADEIVSRLRERVRAQCEGAARARVDAAIGGRQVDGSTRQELLASIGRAMTALPVRSLVVESLALEVLATGNGTWVERVHRRLEQLQDLKEILFRANQPLVVSIAARYAHAGVSLFDLVQEGNRGLRKAVDRFEPASGLEFSTYAAWWIRQAIRRAQPTLTAAE